MHLSPWEMLLSFYADPSFAQPSSRFSQSTNQLNGEKIEYPRTSSPPVPNFASGEREIPALFAVESICLPLAFPAPKEPITRIPRREAAVFLPFSLLWIDFLGGLIVLQSALLKVSTNVVEPASSGIQVCL